MLCRDRALSARDRRDLADLAANDVVAFARPCLEPALVHDLDPPTVVTDETCLLQHVGDDRHRSAAHAERLRQELMGELDGIAFEPIAGLQQPAAQARLDGVQCVASRGLLDLNKQDLADIIAYLRGEQ